MAAGTILEHARIDRHNEEARTLEAIRLDHSEFRNVTTHTGVGVIVARLVKSGAVTADAFPAEPRMVPGGFGPRKGTQFIRLRAVAPPMDVLSY